MFNHSSVTLVSLALASSLQSVMALPQFKLKELLGHSWNHEIIRYDIEPGDIVALSRGARLVDSEGNETLFQLDKDKGKVAFMANVAPYTTQVYRFQAGRSRLTTDLTVKSNNEIVQLSNAGFGLRLRKQFKDNKGPIHSWRLPSGKWVGGSSLHVTSPVTQYALEVTSKGPVEARAICRFTFENGGHVEITFAMLTGNPLVRIAERFDCPSDTGTLQLNFAGGFVPDQIVYRAGGSFPDGGREQQLGYVVVEGIAPNCTGTLFQLEPWLHWQNAKKRGLGFALLNRIGDDVVFFSTANPASWVNPKIGNRAASLIPLIKQKDGRITLNGQLREGERVTLLGATSKAIYIAHLAPPAEDSSVTGERAEAFSDVLAGESAVDLIDVLAGENTAELLDMQAGGIGVDLPDVLAGVAEKDRYKATLEQMYRTQYSDFPLDWVKDLTLEWTRKQRVHPRMIVTPTQLKRFKSTFEVDQNALAELRRSPIQTYNLDGILPTYLATEDPELGARLVSTALDMVERHVQEQLSGTIMSVGVAPHSYQKGFPATLNLVDAVLDSDQMDDAAKTRIYAQIAFMGYMLARPAYWDSTRGFGAMFINMHTTVAAVRCTIAAILPDHPMSQEWMDLGMSYVKSELLDRWSDTDGKWIGTHVEAPHYAICSYDDILGLFLMAHNTGCGDEIFGDTIKQMGHWLAAVSTPRDVRIKGWRHLAPIGNTYKFEPSGIFGVLAGIFQQRAPEYAAAMQWMQKEQGDPLSPGVGGFNAAFCGYRKIIGNSSFPAKAPYYGSEWFNEAGVVLRDNYASPTETMMYMIAGRGATPQRHYDRDQGAITLWAHGQIVSDDFGYNGCAPEMEQSMVSSPAARGIMQVSDFSTSPHMDYVAGTKGSWRRQVALVKGENNGRTPSYFVIHDSFTQPASATWRLWVSAKPVESYGVKLLEVGLKTTEENAMENAMDDVLDDALSMTSPIDEASVGTKSIYLGSKDVLVNGFNGVQTDIIFAQLPEGASIRTASLTKTPAGVNGAGCYVGKNPTTQIGLTLQSKRFASLLTLVFSRPEDAPSPTVEAIAGNRGFKITNGGCTDYVFLGEAPVAYEGGGASFKGQVGFARIVNGAAQLTLMTPGEITAAGNSLTK